MTCPRGHELFDNCEHCGDCKTPRNTTIDEEWEEWKFFKAIENISKKVLDNRPSICIIEYNLTGGIL